MATKTKAVAAAKVSNVSKKVTQGASKIYTAVKFLVVSQKVCNFQQK